MKWISVLTLLFCFVSLPVQAKDYFGLNLATETIDSATQKAKSLFADNNRIEDAGLRIVGNGLLRFYGWFDYMDVRFSTARGIRRIDVVANNLSDAQQVKLIKHLHEDYDLADLSVLPYRGKDIRGIAWDVRLDGRSVLISLTNEVDH
jgi:hypothetical protein